MWTCRGRHGQGWACVAGSRHSSSSSRCSATQAAPVGWPPPAGPAQQRPPTPNRARLMPSTAHQVPKPSLPVSSSAHLPSSSVGDSSPSTMRAVSRQCVTYGCRVLRTWPLQSGRRHGQDGSWVGRAAAWYAAQRGLIATATTQDCCCAAAFHHTATGPSASPTSSQPAPARSPVRLCCKVCGALHSGASKVAGAADVHAVQHQGRRCAAVVLLEHPRLHALPGGACKVVQHPSCRRYRRQCSEGRAVAAGVSTAPGSPRSGTGMPACQHWSSWTAPADSRPSQVAPGRTVIQNSPMLATRVNREAKVTKAASPVRVW
jgi:hypothetical protein